VRRLLDPLTAWNTVVHNRTLMIAKLRGRYTEFAEHDMAGQAAAGILTQAHGILSLTQAKMYLAVAEQACNVRSFPVAAKYIKSAKPLARALPTDLATEAERLVLRQEFVTSKYRFLLAGTEHIEAGQALHFHISALEGLLSFIRGRDPGKKKLLGKYPSLHVQHYLLAGAALRACGRFIQSPEGYAAINEAHFDKLAGILGMPASALGSSEALRAALYSQSLEILTTATAPDLYTDTIASPQDDQTLPLGWTKVASSTRAGQYTFVDVLRGKRVSARPQEPALAGLVTRVRLPEEQVEA
jgi:hypothetical protein